MQFVFSQVGPWGAVAAIAFLFATGRIVPQSMLRDRERLIDLYQDAFEREHKAREIADKQLGEMLEYGRTANHVLAALPASAASPKGDSDETSVA